MKNWIVLLLFCHLPGLLAEGNLSTPQGTNLYRAILSPESGVPPVASWSDKEEVVIPTSLEPTPKVEPSYNDPEFYTGIYLTAATIRHPERYRPLLARARKHGVNTLVVDIQPRFPDMDFIRHARESDFYLVARLVVFEQGLKRYPPDLEHLGNILDLAERAGRNGFMEVQLDYIRFADTRRLKLSLEKRYRLIAGVLKMTTERLRPLGVRVGADIFGRIPFNQDDRIGQKVELFAEHMDVLYPMLYPSHFYGDPHFIRDPYKTVRQGVEKSLRRVDKDTRIVPYIQGFAMKLRPSGLSLVGYIRKQIEAVKDAKGAGYVVWNARNDYDAFFKALAPAN